MPAPDAILACLRDHRDKLRREGVARLALFGSTARGEAGAASDIDLIAAFDPRRRVSLLDIVRIERRLSSLLGRPVDLVEEGRLDVGVEADAARDLLRAF